MYIHNIYLLFLFVNKYHLSYSLIVYFSLILYNIQIKMRDKYGNKAYVKKKEDGSVEMR